MRCLVRFILGLTIFCGSAAASILTVDNLSANPRSARILSINTPLDPQRKVCVSAPSEGVPRASGHRMDQRVLKYLRVMIGICRRKNRRDMVWYYSDAWEFASTQIYGSLPPRKDLNDGISYQPDNPPLPDPPPGPVPALRSRPLRKIIKLVIKPYRTWQLTYEQLECGHQLLAPAGHSVAVQRRRCIDCARQAQSARKKPAAGLRAHAQRSA